MTPKDVGSLISALRKKMHVTQRDLAMTAGTGLRFISDLENGKPTCELGKTLHVPRINMANIIFNMILNILTIQLQGRYLNHYLYNRIFLYHVNADLFLQVFCRKEIFEKT